MSLRRWLLAAMVLCAGWPVVHAGQTAEKKADAKVTVPVFRLTGTLHESPVDETFSFSGETGISLKELIARMKKASDDAAVKAVVVLFEGASVGRAQTEEIRQAMTKLKAAGKEVYVHSDSLAMGEYALLSGATRLSVVPTADLWVTGFYGEAPYLRGLLDKLGVKPDFLTCGDYKSAAEMFMRDGPSPEADRMQNWLLDGLYDSTVKLIAEGRRVDAAKVKGWIDNGPYIAEKAKAAGLVDAVEHRQELTALLQEKFGKDVVFDRKYGTKQQPTVDFSSPFGMMNLWAEILGGTQKKKSTKPAVAIVYVDGPIELGSGVPSIFGETGAMSSAIRKALDDAARDDTIKAVVLRVNSPGGSAVASEIILDATKRVKAKKPFVVSMGDVAGSGGYYVACGSDIIFADEATITGSIGVVGGKLATTEMWKKIGVTFKAYQRGANAALLGNADVFSKPERERMQAWMDEIYGVFKGHVIAARGNRLKKPIDELAGGRVYTGKQALELGLVDKIGTLRDAIDHVAGEAKLAADYEIRIVPEPKNFLEQLSEELSGHKDENTHRIDLAGRFVPRSSGTSFVELALPYLQHLDPHRVATIKLALQRLQMIHQDGAVLMMPEITLSR